MDRGEPPGPPGLQPDRVPHRAPGCYSEVLRRVQALRQLACIVSGRVSHPGDWAESSYLTGMGALLDSIEIRAQGHLPDGSSLVERPAGLLNSENLYRSAFEARPLPPRSCPTCGGRLNSASGSCYSSIGVLGSFDWRRTTGLEPAWVFDEHLNAGF